MRSKFLGWVAVGALLVLPVGAYAQEVTVVGAVTDTTGGALPGVTVTAQHEASGNVFEAVTDAEGRYRIPARVGGYNITATLAGFGTVERSGVTLLVGQEGVVNLELSVGGVQETVTVTGEAPLLDLTESTISGNIDPLQLSELPVMGRNWMELTTLAPGSRMNAVGEVPVGGMASNGVIMSTFQLNVDGQQITSSTSWGASDGQPHYSRDSIGEFEFVASRFDVTQGRSAQVQVNVITKSGTNTPSGSFSGFFRHDSMNAADFVAERVLPFSNQQYSVTFGGPITQDRVHYFANYERETQPTTHAYTTPYPAFNSDIQFTNKEWKTGIRLDSQFSPQIRFTTRLSAYSADFPGFRAGSFSERSPSTNSSVKKEAQQYLGTLTSVLSNRAVNEVKIGYSTAQATVGDTFVNYSKNPFDGKGGPVIELVGFRTGGNNEHPEKNGQDTYMLRDDLTYAVGNHTVKAGGEWLYNIANDFRCSPCDGALDARAGPLPANFNDLVPTIFPDQYDADTWNLQPLNDLGLVLRWTQAFGDGAGVIPKHMIALWLQDDWSVSDRLTLNLGLRYDLERNAYGQTIQVDPRWLPSHSKNDGNNVGPRGGFSFSVDDRTQLRGGAGLYWATLSNPQLRALNAQMIITSIENDGRADFAVNPWGGGETPTFASLDALRCVPGDVPTPLGTSDCVQRTVGSLISRHWITEGDGINAGTDPYPMPRSIQASLGIQRQVSDSVVVEADYVFLNTKDLPHFLTNNNINLSWDPVSKTNYPFGDTAEAIANRIYPDWQVVVLTPPGTRMNMHSFQLQFTKRMTDNWQASGNYNLSWLRDAYPAPWSGTKPLPFTPPVDYGGEYSLGVTDQRHRGAFNAIYQLPAGFQLSGMYLFGSGDRYRTQWGGDLRNMGAFGPWRLRPDGTIVPRNNFVGSPIHRVDIRLQRRFALGGPVTIDGIVELFNVLNHENYGSYQTREASANYGAQSSNDNNAYQPRRAQVGFRLLF